MNNDTWFDRLIDRLERADTETTPGDLGWLAAGLVVWFVAVLVKLFS